MYCTCLVSVEKLPENVDKNIITFKTRGNERKPSTRTLGER